jgi:serine/threonine protein kinase
MGHCIGEGACGEVWLARNALGTLRAVKIVYRSRFKDDRPYEREFDGILKYEPVSRMHEGLVHVLHAGRSDDAGCFYYVMELADADEKPDPGSDTGGLNPNSPPASNAVYRPRTLRSELSRRQRLPPTEAAQLTLRLARALAYLHDHGLVHRDIKPSNVIFVSGQPKLADIGLVTDVGSSHSFVGTEGFIPPEGPGTPQADLYALGKVLYELATGRDRMDFPQLPAGLNAHAEPSSNSATPSSSKPAPMCAAANLASASAPWVADDRLLATLPPSTNLMTHDATWSDDGRFLTVKRVHDSTGHRNDLEVWRVDEPRLVRVIRDVRSLARSFHPTKPQLLTGDAQGSVVVWDLESGEERSRLTFEIIPEYLVYSPEGDRVATSYRDPDGWGVSIHNAADGALLTSRVLPHLVSSLVWHPEGKCVAFTDHGGAAHLLDSQSGELRTLGMHKAEAATAVFTPGGEYLLTGGWERELICWDTRTFQRAMTIGLDSYVAHFRADGRTCALFTQTGVQFHTFEYPATHRRFPEHLGPRLRHAAFSPDSRWLAASADGRVGVWDLSRNTAGALTAISPDGRWLAICRTYSPVLHIYRLPEMIPVAQLTNQANIEGFSFSPDHRELGVTSRGHLEFWSTTNWHRTRAATNFIGIPDVGLLYSQDGRNLWLAKDYRTAGFYQVHTLDPIFFLPTGIFPLALSPDGTLAAVAAQLSILTPFAMSNPVQFRPDPPYAPTLEAALASAAYATDVNEVKVIGSVDSAIRTSDQTELARLWQAMGPVDQNRAARSVILAGNRLVDNARLFALLNLASCDTGEQVGNAIADYVLANFLTPVR